MELSRLDELKGESPPSMRTPTAVLMATRCVLNWIAQPHLREGLETPERVEGGVINGATRRGRAWRGHTKT